MTEPKRTMMLSPNEWRALVYAGASGICNYINMMTGAPSQDKVAEFHETLDRLKMQVSAWAASALPAVPKQGENVAWSQQYDPADFSPIAQTNGTGSVVPAGPKKKRGWQKGRKRGPRKPRIDEAVQ